jgi:superfamily II DNA or RNA helicase
VLLRDYQQAAIDQFLAEPKVPTLIVAPTGAGKGTMAAYVLGRYALREKRAVFLVHRRELVHDMAERLRQQGVRAGESLASPRAVRVVSVQAALHATKTTPPDLLVVDEAHHYAAEEWAEVVGRLRPRALLGLTATPQRADGKPLGDMFARLIDAVPYSLLLARGVIVPCRVLRAPRRMRAQEIARDPVDAYLAHARGMSALVYVARVGEARRVAEALTARGVRARYLHARTRRTERAEMLAALRDGALDVIANVGILTEGVDPVVLSPGGTS